MDFTPEQLTALRKKMLLAFDKDSLDLFLQDYLNIILAEVVNTLVGFEMVCNLFLRWARQEGKLQLFLQAVVQQHDNAAFKQFAWGLLAKPAPADNGASKRPFIFANRLLLDRSSLWERLDGLAAGREQSRVLVVSGGVGKTYSQWPVSSMCPEATGLSLARVDVAAGKIVDVDALRLATLISNRLGGNTKALETDDLAQAVRQGNDLGEMLVQLLSNLPKQTWLILDQLNAVNLDSSAADVISRLCEAVDARECPNVRLFLFGLDREKLSSRIRGQLLVDLVGRPSKNDISEYLVWFANSANKQLSEQSLETAAAKLDAVLTELPAHAHWATFHEELEDQCRKIKEGMAV